MNDVSKTLTPMSKVKERLTVWTDVVVFGLVLTIVVLVAVGNISNLGTRVQDSVDMPKNNRPWFKSWLAEASETRNENSKTNEAVSVTHQQKKIDETIAETYDTKSQVLGNVFVLDEGNVNQRGNEGKWVNDIFVEDWNEGAVLSGISSLWSKLFSEVIVPEDQNMIRAKTKDGENTENSKKTVPTNLGLLREMFVDENEEQEVSPPHQKRVTKPMSEFPIEAILSRFLAQNKIRSKIEKADNSDQETESGKLSELLKQLFPNEHDTVSIIF
jgi:hypothetical protein